MRAAFVSVILWLGFFAPIVDAATLSWSRMPTNTMVELGGTAVFYGEAHPSTPQPVSYQWFKNYEELPGATNATLVVSNVNFGTQSNLFMLWASIPDDTRNSNPAFITVPHSPPVARFPLAFEPSGVIGSNFVAHVQMAGDPPLYYQWYEGPRPIYGETGTELRIHHNFSRGPYYTVVSNAFGVSTGQVFNVNLMYPPEVLASSYRTGMVGIALEPAPDGDLYVARNKPEFGQVPAGGFEIGRMDSNLSEKWNLEFRSTGSEAGAMLSDTNGNVFVWAKFDRSLIWSNNAVSVDSFPNGVLIKMNPAGEILSMEVVGEGETQKAVAMTVRSNVLWTAEDARTSPGIVTVLKALLRTFDLDGKPIGQLLVTNLPTVPLSTNGSVSGFRIEDFALREDGGFILAGSVRAVFTWPDRNATVRTFPRLVSYDAEGNILWVHDPVGDLNETSTPYEGSYKSLCLDTNGNIFAALNITRGSFPQTWILRFAPDGEEFWRLRAMVLNGFAEAASSEKIELLPEGNLRVTGYARGQNLLIGSVFFRDGPFVLDLTTDGKLNWPAMLSQTETRLTIGSAEDSLQLPSGKLYVTGRHGLGNFTAPSSYVAELGYGVPRETMPVPSTHVVTPENGLTLRPNIFAAGPVAFEWRRDGHVLGEESFAAISLSPAELERPARYQLIVRSIGGSYTNTPISVGWARTRVNPPNGARMDVALPAGDRFSIEEKTEFATDAIWTFLTNTVSTGATYSLEFNPADMQKFLRVVPER